jgi:cysteine desulfurase
MNGRIYLDHAATTPLRAEARAAMEPFLGPAAFGNPSSLHADGQTARRALDGARDTIARALGAEHSEISFTSGGTEADNAALVGFMFANRERGSHLVTTQIEHEAVLRTCKFLETLGFTVSYVPSDENGLLSPPDIDRALTPNTILVSVMHANNETGVIQPIREISQLVRARGVAFHTDAVQSFGLLPIGVDEIGVDLLSLSAHKIYGPKGVGALYTRTGLSMEPLLHGGGQERERRAGTENVAAIAGFAEAVRLLLSERDDTAARLVGLRDRFVDALLAAVAGAILNGHSTERLPNNVNVSFDGCDNESLLLSLDRAGISASSGSACSSGSIEPSHVLLAMGLPETRVRAAVRFTLGRDTTWEELETTVEAIREIVKRVRR